MTSLTYGELELLICLHFPIAATRTRRSCPFDVASGPFKWPGGALMWPLATLKKSSLTQKEKKKAKKS